MESVILAVGAVLLVICLMILRIKGSKSPHPDAEILVDLLNRLESGKNGKHSTQ